MPTRSGSRRWTRCSRAWSGSAWSSACRRTTAGRTAPWPTALIDAFAADATAIAEQIGQQALDELLAAHRLWSDWLRDGRIRKLAFVAEMASTP